MTIRCKFRVESKEETVSTGNIPTYNVKMTPVYGNADPESENSKFWKWTPSGEFKMSSINEKAAEQLIVGKEYYIDIIRAK